MNLEIPIRAQALLLIVALVSSVCSLRAGEILDLDEKPGGDDIAKLLGEELTTDLSLLNVSHVSMLNTWEGVKQHGTKSPGPFTWQAEGAFVMPSGEGAISALIDVPESATYRVYLRHQLATNTAIAVTLSLTPQISNTDAAGKTTFVDAEPVVSHVYGQTRLGGGLRGKEIEKQRPVRFEGDEHLVATPTDGTTVWEFRDLELKKGVYRAALLKADKRVRASALLLTRSKDFRPSLSNSIGKIYLRFRASDASGQQRGKFSVDSGLGYHWGPRPTKTNSEGVWSWPIGNTAATPMGQWSPFIEATEAIVPGPGPWSTLNLGISGIASGTLEVQFAWFAHEKAVALTQKTGVGGGRALLRVPHGNWLNAAEPGVPVWGMWSGKSLKQVLTQEAIVERYFVWAQKAAERLGVKEGHPLPKNVRLYCGCGVLPSNQERAAEMLAKLGVNWIDGAPQSIKTKYGLHDETSAFNTSDAAGLAAGKSEAERKKLTKIKIGDEIGTLTDAAVINADPARRERFHAFLSEAAGQSGMSVNDFLGVDDLSAVDCISHLSDNPGRYERRLYHLSHRFGHLATCDDYRRTTQAFEKYFPNVRVYNNYSPHPVFLTGTTMNHGDWFILPRNKAQTLGWAEDWATGGSWGLGTHYQCTSFYAALVECGVRKHGYPFGFYVGTNCGGSAEKIFGCLAQGASWLHLYDWGPIDRWAEGSNAWSEHEGEYYSVMCASHAIGPADEIIGRGKREARRTAILYNRSHEIMQEGAGRLNHDWMWTFIALKGAQIPVDVIIEEDLNADDLKRYDCLFVGGYNLAKQHVAVVKKWVEAGGVLIASGGSAQYDAYGDASSEAAELFGARQKAVSGKNKTPLGAVKFAASDDFPAAEFIPGGPAFFLQPAAAKSVATYAGGECAAAVNVLGKGKAILLGFQPGVSYRDNGRAAGKARAWLAAPVLKRLGRQRVEFDHYASEATLFEHESGLAVMLASFGGPSPEGGSQLSVQTDRQVKEVFSALRGPLEWKRAGERIEIKTKRLEPVDVIVLK
ncbi:MAG TPA: hypothetical protein VEK08_13730 [Planctomycetota bacterium]|nr:hypothetical protein [Planctomycetota bacterium]